MFRTINKCRWLGYSERVQSCTDEQRAAQCLWKGGGGNSCCRTRSLRAECGSLSRELTWFRNILMECRSLLLFEIPSTFYLERSSVTRSLMQRFVTNSVSHRITEYMQAIPNKTQRGRKVPELVLNMISEPTIRVSSTNVVEKERVMPNCVQRKGLYFNSSRIWANHSYYYTRKRRNQSFRYIGIVYQHTYRFCINLRSIFSLIIRKDSHLNLSI